MSMEAKEAGVVPAVVGGMVDVVHVALTARGVREVAAATANVAATVATEVISMYLSGLQGMSLSR